MEVTRNHDLKILRYTRLIGIRVLVSCSTRVLAVGKSKIMIGSMTNPGYFFLCFLLFGIALSATAVSTASVAVRGNQSAAKVKSVNRLASPKESIGQEHEQQQLPGLHHHRSLEEDEMPSDPQTDKCAANDIYAQFNYQQEDEMLEQWDAQNLNQNQRSKLDKTCPSKTSNPRGTYTSNLNACTFRFHHIEQDDRSDPLSLSAACSEANRVSSAGDSGAGSHGTTPLPPPLPPVEQYVVGWPDECVGDYQRCYSIVQDEQILLRHLCKSYHKGEDLPAGTTHVSVDCTEDKTLKKEQLSKTAAWGISSSSIYNDPFMQQEQARERKQIHEMFEFVFAMVAICLVACFACLFCCYRFGFRPYLAALKRGGHNNRRRMDDELEGLAKEEDGGEDDTESSSTGLDDSIGVTGTAKKPMRSLT
jgi:hypothetical protein